MAALLQNKSFRRILAGYLLILLLPVLAGLGISFYFARSLAESRVEINSFSVERLGRNGDALLSEASLRCASVAEDEVLKVVISTGEETGIANDLRYQINHCARLLTPGEFFTRQYIYFHLNQSLLCYDQRITSEMLERKFSEFLGMDREDFWNVVTAAGLGGCAFVREIGGRQRLIYARPVVSQRNYAYVGAVIGVLADGQVADLLGDYPMEGRLYLLDEDRCLYGDASGIGSDRLDLAAADPFSVHLGKRTVAAEHASNYGALRYAAVLPVWAYNRPVRISIWIVAGYACICLLIGGVYALYLSRREYAVVDKFLSLTSADTPDEAVGAIQRTLRRAAERRRELETVEYDRTREKLLSELLIGGAELSRERMQFYGITLDRSGFAAALFSADGYEDLFFGENKELSAVELADTAFLIVRSVAEELCGAVSRAYVTRVGEDPVVILSFDGPESEVDGALNASAAFIEENFGLHFNVTRGRRVNRPEELADSFRAARNAQRLTTQESEGDDRAADLAGRIRSLIETQYADPQLSIPRIGEMLGFSDSHISHAFKQQTGITVLEYINGVRVAAAKELLLSTDESVSAVAARVGYTGVDAFTRAMRKFEGVTPGSYRKLHREL